MKVMLSIIPEAFSALWTNRLRSFLTILGMVMGVTSVITIVSAVEGMQSSIENIFESMGPRSFIVSRFGFNVTWSEYLKLLKRKKLTVDLIEPIKSGCPDCDEVGAEAYKSDHLKYGKSRMRWVEIRGETPNLLSTRKIDVLLGRYISDEDDARRRQVAFIGHEVYDKFFKEKDEDPLGKIIKIGNREFTVIGVAEKLDTEIVQGLDECAIIPISTHQKIYRQPGNPVNFVISAVSLERREKAMDQVRVVLRSARHIPYDEKDDFAMFTPDNILSFINDITQAFRVILISLPLLSIIIGGIVIMNIMMISVTERTREIGIRKSLGASRGNILIQFLYESVILSMIGGGIGLLLGVQLGTWILNSVMDIYITPTTLAVILGLGISTGVGLFFGIYPARKAAKLDPIKALTYE
ncbi:MAG: ABC transporter permease [candidate division Zixibacteria bacterium]|nr:ABC transporter permease [candidate division Zixibacteria bacterium]